MRELGWGDLAEKDESQDFIECEDYSVLFRKGDARPGDFVARDGKVLGQHRGIIHYTIGQRKGLELGGGGTPLTNPADIVGLVGNTYLTLIAAVTSDHVSTSVPA